MDHVAIMRPSWKLLPKILSGEKKIESRWYKTRCEAWGKVQTGDMIWFKDSGKPVTVYADVERVIEFNHLNPQRVRKIIYKYGAKDGISSDNLEFFCHWAKDKKYCVLVFLKNPRPVSKPFQINKKGFGSARAFISVKNIDTIKIK
jgi:ASC-1-like (ASCH) protein